MQTILALCAVLCFPLLTAQRYECMLDCPNGLVPGQCKCQPDNLGVQMMPNDAMCSIQCANGLVPGECRCQDAPAGYFPGRQTFKNPCDHLNCTSYQTCRIISGRGICVMSLFSYIGSWARQPASANDVVVNKCEEPKVRGNCRGFLRRYYYDVNSGRCVSFIYSGCGQNRNNFRTLRECLLSCSQYRSAA